tara:strand:- start:2594 stop:3259 length:666 start_codon:yes stop_codon:yes gene_type:complete
MSKIIAIGDIHGELGKLKDLFAKLSFSKEDTIVFLGDYIDRGKESKGVIDFILDLKDKCNLVALKGNHEQFALDTFKDPEGNMAGSWVMNGGINTLTSYQETQSLEKCLTTALKTMERVHGDFLKSLPIIHETENHIFVHGFLEGAADTDDQDEIMCIWGRYKDIWPHKSGKTVVCGHSVQRDGAVDDGFKICIDTGSFKPKGYITALVVENYKKTFITSQ